MNISKAETLYLYEKESLISVLSVTKRKRKRIDVVDQDGKEFTLTVVNQEKESCMIENKIDGKDYLLTSWMVIG